MQALILAGGEGTRLRPLTETVPKPVLPLAGRPLIGYMFEWLARHGVDDIVVSCGFLAAGIREALAGIDARRVRFVEEPEPLGTGGAIGFAAEMLDERFLALNGDVLADLDLSALLSQHESSGARATVALYPVEDPSAYGLVRRSPDGEIREFVEKPKPEEIGGDEINAGAYVLERSVLELVPEGRAVSIERDVFPRLVGGGLYGRRLEGYWLDIGTPARYLEATRDILERRVRTSVGDSLDDRGLLIDPRADVDSPGDIDPPAVIGHGARLEAGCRVVGPAVIGPNSTVERSATVDRSVLFDSCRIGAGATVSGAILAAGVEVAGGLELESGAVIGEGARA